MRWIVIVSIVGLACGRLNFEPTESLVPSDGSTDGGPACATGFGPWDNVQRLVDVSTAEFDLAAALHPNNLVLVFDTAGIGGNRSLLASKRSSTADQFEAPTALVTLNSAPDNNMQAAWSPDGGRLHFHRLGGTVNERMVADYLGGTSFAAPVIDSTFPSTGDNGSFSPDGQELFFTSYSGDANVSHARLVGGSWVVDGEIDAVNSQLEEGYPTFDAPRNTIYFERDNGIGGTEIAFAKRPDATSPFGQASVLPELMMASGKNGDPEVSADGTTMVFASERTGSALIDLYLATRSCQ